MPVDCIRTDMPRVKGTFLFADVVIHTAPFNSIIACGATRRYVYICACVSVCVHLYVHMGAWVHACACVTVHVCMCKCMHVVCVWYV